MPAEQLEHEDALATEYAPAAQLVHVVIAAAAAAAEYKPPAQAKQSAEELAPWALL